MARAAISIMAFEPSTKLHSIFGFMCLLVASSAGNPGVASGLSGLFLPLPAQTTSNARSRANSTRTDGLGGFVAAAQCVDLAGVPGQCRQQESDRDVAFHIEQSDVLAGPQRGQGQSGADVRHAGGVDDHVDVRVGQCPRVGEHGVPLAAVGVGVDPDGLVGVDDPVGVDVGDGPDLQAGDSLDLGDEPGSHLAGAGQADPDRTTGLLFTFLQSVLYPMVPSPKSVGVLVSSVGSPATITTRLPPGAAPAAAFPPR